MEIVVFSRFERFWHWTQACLIILLLATGFEVNGAYHFLGYERAAGYHRIIAWCLVSLWVFAIFWHMITGEWKQYIPTTRKLVAVINYYTKGIFDPEVMHPFNKTRLSKHNPLQRIAYLTFNIIIAPIIWTSGWLYMFYNDWPRVGLQQWLTLGGVALVHAAAAFAILVFFIAHVYMAFTGRPPTAYVRAMLTGKERVAEDAESGHTAS